MNPVVSVVIPTYNHARYLACAIGSVLTQTFAQWEAIVVDDGSTDNPFAVVAQLGDPRIRYIYQTNQGLAAARNTGIGAAKGEYLAFLDADDEWECEFLQHTLNTLSADDSLAGVFTRNRFIDRDGQVLLPLGGQVVSRADLYDRLLEGGFFPPNTVLVRTAVVRQAGLFDTQLSGVADWDLWLRISQRHSMQAIPEALARYRVCPGSMSTNPAKMHDDRMRALAKHFGLPERDPLTWPHEKRRAYGYALRCSCIGYLQQRQPDEGWCFLAQAVWVWPDLLKQLDTFYELACGDKPWGYRGQADLLNIESNGADLLKRLNGLFIQVGIPLRYLRRPAFGNAYLSLGILSDQAGRWAAARRYLWQAVRANPRLLTSYTVVWRLFKLYIAWPLIEMGRKVFRREQQTAHPVR